MSLLRDDIGCGRLQPGQRIVETQLSEDFGVSRTTIREAIRHLAVEGLLTVVPQRGAQVALSSREVAADLYEARALLEGALARCFVQRAGPVQLEVLVDALHQLELGVATDDPTTALGAKDRFYAALVDGASNQVLADIVETLRARVALLRSQTMAVAGRPAQSLSELRRIVDAVIRRDADGAAEAATAHVRNAALTLLAFGDASGVEPAARCPSRGAPPTLSTPTQQFPHFSTR